MKISSSSDENVEGEEENFEQYFESNSPDLKMAR